MTSLLPFIYKKRAGEILSKEDIESFVQSLIGTKPPPDYQIASLLAFIYSKGMTPEETLELTMGMRASGDSFQYKNFPKDAFFADKHSTGGVGDKITLPLMPLVAAASERVHVPTIAGRALGHTGGTVDKLESIPGCSLSLTPAKFYQILKKHRVCFLAQTSRIAPADRILYALRDVTGTVESIPLITASILSKKLSESLNYLLLDVKFGNGAFLSEMPQTEALAQSLLRVCHLAGVKAQVAITKMDTPLGFYSGNRLEVFETLQILKGQGPAASTALTMDFAIKILEASGLSLGEAMNATKSALETGAALEHFEKVIAAQGGSLKKFEKQFRPERLKWKSVGAPGRGTLTFNTRALGLALVELGAGRKTKADKVDLDVGFFHPLEHGDRVEKGQEVLRIAYRDNASLARCLKFLEQSRAIEVKDAFTVKTPLIRKVLAA